MFSAKRQEYKPTKTPFRYRGEYFDSETGNIYLRARYYVPNLGRFTQQDGLQYADFKNPTTLNLYAYCGNNPNNMKDSSGHFWETLLDIGSAVYSAVQFVKEPSWANAGYLLWDVGAAVIPVVPGSYSARAVRALANGAEAIADTSRVVDVADTAADTARVVDEAVDAGRTASSQAPLEGFCFVAGTLVAAADGDRPIEEIQVGDEVYAENPKTGEVGLKEVVRLFLNETQELVHVFTGDEEIQTTTTHPFWVEDKGWVPAGELESGDVLLSLDGTYSVVERIAVECLDEPIAVYNFEVADWHTYFVSESQVLVHNMCAATGSIDGGVGNVTTKPIQAHHFASDKNSYYTPLFKEITDKYGLDLKGDWNVDSMLHQGRHPNEYHIYILKQLQAFDSKASGDTTQFLTMYKSLKQTVMKNPEILTKNYWWGK